MITEPASSPERKWRRIALMYVNHDSGDAFFQRYGTSGLAAQVESEAEDAFSHWETCLVLGIKEIWIHVDFNWPPLEKKKRELPVKWSKRWKLDSKFGIFECRGIAIDAMGLRKEFGRDYQAGAEWIARKLRAVAGLALKEIEKNLLQRP